MADNFDTIETLRSVAQHVGRADTLIIHQRSWFSKDMVRYYFGKLDDKGLNLVECVDSMCGRDTPPKTITLSDAGRRVLNKIGEIPKSGHREDLA